MNSSTLSTPSATQAANKQALLRQEDNALLRGQGQFGHDIQLPHLQYVAFVRSTQAHATINGIHTAEALQVPGVLQIFTAADLGVLHLPHINPLLPLMHDTAFPVLAMHEVAYVGQPIAVVVADSRHAARLAAGLVEVDLQTLPPHNDFDNTSPTVTQTQHHVGTVPSADARSVEAKIISPRVSACPLEPRACTASWHEASQQLTVWLGTQTPSRAQSDIATLLGLPLTQVHLISPDVGGAFGARASVGNEDLLVPWVARHLKTAVQWVATRSEDFLAGM